MKAAPPGDTGPVVGPLAGDGQQPDDEVLQAILAAVETVLRRRTPARVNKPAPHGLWRFSGRAWATPAPLSRARPLR